MLFERYINTTSDCVICQHMVYQLWCMLENALRHPNYSLHYNAILAAATAGTTSTLQLTLLIPLRSMPIK